MQTKIWRGSLDRTASLFWQTVNDLNQYERAGGRTDEKERRNDSLSTTLTLRREKLQRLA